MTGLGADGSEEPGQGAGLGKNHHGGEGEKNQSKAWERGQAQGLLKELYKFGRNTLDLAAPASYPEGHFFPPGNDKHTQGKVAFLLVLTLPIIPTPLVSVCIAL